MDVLLNFSVPFDVAVFDQVVAVFNDAAHPQRALAERVLNAFRERAWSLVFRCSAVRVIARWTLRRLALQTLTPGLE
jgi:hypothetical protein